MNEIITQLIAAAIDPAKIPGLDCFDMSQRDKGLIIIRLNDLSFIKIKVTI